MKIVDQGRERVFNFDNCFEISLDGDCICLRATYDSRYRILGRYPEGRAKEVFDEMLKVAFPIQAVLFANISADDMKMLSEIQIPGAVIRTSDGRVDYDVIKRSVYYMPEE